MNKGLTHPHEIVAPVRPIAPWLGGKRNLAKRICALTRAKPTTAAMPNRSWAWAASFCGGHRVRAQR